MNKGDVETAWSCYQDQAVLIAQQGNIARGRDAIRAVLEGLISLKLSGEKPINLWMRETLHFIVLDGC
jgi:ketosteroid isomerase-like protein